MLHQLFYAPNNIGAVRLGTSLSLHSKLILPSPVEILKIQLSNPLAGN